MRVPVTREKKLSSFMLESHTVDLNVGFYLAPNLKWLANKRHISLSDLYRKKGFDTSSARIADVSAPSTDRMGG